MMTITIHRAYLPYRMCFASAVGRHARRMVDAQTTLFVKVANRYLDTPCGVYPSPG